MANQKEAINRLKLGGKLINGMICDGNNGLDMSTTGGRLTAKQLTSLEAKGVKRYENADGTVIHTL